MPLTFKIPLIGLLLIVLSIAGVAAPVYLETERDLQLACSQQLLGIARTGTLLIDADAHEDIFRIDEEEIEGYGSFASIRDTLESIRTQNQIFKPIYTMRRALDFEETLELEFVVMTDEVDGQPYVGNRMKTNEYIEQVYASGEAVTTPLYEDAEGHWLSAIAPITDDTGEVVAILSIDRSGKEYLAALARVRKQFLSAAVVASLISALFLIVFVQPLVSRIRLLKRRTGEVMRGDLNVTHDPIRGRDELGELLKSFQSMTKELSTQRSISEEALEAAQAATRAKASFLANMSHEIRTPMTSVLGFADLLAAPGISPEQRRDYLATLRRNGEHLLSVINDILDFSKIEAGKMDVDVVETSLFDAIYTVDSMLGPKAEEKGLRLELDLSFPLPATIETDPQRLRQVLINLAGNSIKFTTEGFVTIVIRYAADPKPAVTLQVIDTGIGMSLEQVDRIFAAFGQADTSTTRRFGGTGLGLSISRSFVELLGGELHVESEPGKGSTFSVTLPVGEAAVSTLVNELPRATDNDEPEFALGEQKTAGRRVLLVDDGPDNLFLISAILERMDLDVTTAENGRDAIDAIHRASDVGTPYDLVLMDMQMPVLDGYEAAAELRAVGCTVPIVALTADALGGADQKCLAAGCDGYLTKPIQLGPFRAEVNKQLSRGLVDQTP